MVCGINTVLGGVCDQGSPGWCVRSRLSLVVCQVKAVLGGVSGQG